MSANSGKLSTTAVDLRAVLRCWANFLYALDIIKTTDALLSWITRDAFSALTPECVPHSRSRWPQVQVWIAFVFTRLSFSCNCVCFIYRNVPASCRRFYEVTSLLWAKKKKTGTKSLPDDDKEVLQLSEVILRRIKWSCKCLLERRGLKMPRFFEKFEKLPFPDLFPVDCCVNYVTMVCRGRTEAALPPNFTTHSSKTRCWKIFGLVAFF